MTLFYTLAIAALLCKPCSGRVIEYSLWSRKTLLPLQRSGCELNELSRQCAKLRGGLMLEPVITGAISGSLHAVTGPDHLSGLIAPCLNKNVLVGLKYGALWSSGHAVTTLILGISTILMKNTLLQKINFLTKYSGIAVGLSLVAIGIIGVYENLYEIPQNNSSEASNSVTNWLIFANGILHGFSLDGVAVLLPSLTLSTASDAIQFLISYSIATILVISSAAGLISASSSSVLVASVPSLPRKLSLYFSILSILLGSFWAGNRVFQL